MSSPFDQRYVTVDGLRTHYLEAGDGPVVLLVHSGEFGASAELSWERLIPLLSSRFRLLAPDMLGYGMSAKVHDFESGYRRRAVHLCRFLEILGIDVAHLVGTSMGGTLLLRDQTADRSILPGLSLTLMSSGGAMLDNEARRTLLDYDCTIEAMRSVVGVIFHDERWIRDEDYVRRRYTSSMIPGAWECAAAARLNNPSVPPRSEFGQPDTFRYEDITLPTLLIAGANDQLKREGYADEVGKRIADSRVAVLDECAHSPNIEHPELVADVLSTFILAHEPS